MPDNITLDIKICDWWIDWYSREDGKNYFCAVVQQGDKKYYIERELENE